MSGLEDKLKIVTSVLNESLEIPSIEDNAIHSSTRIIEENVEKVIISRGRYALKPEINQQTNTQLLVTNNTDTEISNLGQHIIIENTDHIQQYIDTNQSNKIELETHPQSMDEVNDKEKIIQNDDNVIDESFDVFILKNFSQFSGNSDVVLCTLRLGQDDTLLNKTKCDVCHTKLANESNTNFSNNSHQLSSAHHSLIQNSESNLGATKLVGELPVTTINTFSLNSSLAQTDPILNDLRKAIVENLIKNPKTFKGEKDDVNKWLEDIEHLLEIAHIPHLTRLDLISYSLRGDALEWFKTNRSSFTSWDLFVTSLKKAFTSNFHEEIAFKKLETYSQGQNQSIRTFFNDVLKLCKEADPTMSETTKLKTLLNKAKANIQYEVRKKRPTTTLEFLEYAKEVEEFMQLSSISLNDSNNYLDDPRVQTPMTSSLSYTPSPTYNQSFSNSSNNYSPQYSRNYDRNSRFQNNQNKYSPPRNSYVPPMSSSQPQSRLNINSQPPPQRYVNNSNQTNNRQNVTSSNTNRVTNTPSRQPTANTIDVSHSSEGTAQEQEIFSSVLCSQCNQHGHDASACSSF
ncbi:unnamed protein product [Adineta steineri]|uniref:Ty3 transposon capsid-like protein domain-containing protein n=1 Tax=Adineta steineri TaxID=433720 RepID=A0A815SKB1_9BILA|nr:unnamed protein product [Adineta steineri]